MTRTGYSRSPGGTIYYWFATGKGHNEGNFPKGRKIGIASNKPMIQSRQAAQYQTVEREICYRYSMVQGQICPWIQGISNIQPQMRIQESLPNDQSQQSECRKRTESLLE